MPYQYLQPECTDVKVLTRIKVSNWGNILAPATSSSVPPSILLFFLSPYTNDCDDNGDNEHSS